MAEIREPNVHATCVRNQETGVIHVFLGDMTGCGIDTTGDKWVLDKTKITCRDCLNNLSVMY